MSETKIIMPEESVDKEKLSDEEKEKILDRAFHPYGDQNDMPLPPAESHPIVPFDGEDAALLHTGQPEVGEALIVRGKMTGPDRGATPRLPLRERASATTEDASLDDVPPMLRAKVLAERAKKQEG